MFTNMAPNRYYPDMVARSYYEEDQAPYRRHSYRGDGYSSSNRPLASGSNHHIYSRGGQFIGDFRNDSPDQDEIPHTRRRIPVACGRCRKRKIRCSGDKGTGDSCDNCKTVGNEVCQFLRVSSTETTMIRTENPVLELDGGNASSRINCHLVPYGTRSQRAQSPSLCPIPFPQRNHSMPPFQYPMKQLYPVNNYDFGEDGLEYGLTHGLGLHLNTFQGDQMGGGNNYIPAQRTWVPNPQPKSLPFLEQQNPPYSHGQTSFNGTSFDARQNMIPDSKSSHLAMPPQSLPSQSFPLPAPINTGMDRFLPLPATVPVNRPQTHQYALPMDGLMPNTYARGSYVENSSPQTLRSDNSPISNNIGNVDDNSSSFQIDNSIVSTSSYPPPLTQSPTQSLSSAQTAYSSSSFSLPSTQSEVFTPPQASYTSSENNYQATPSAIEDSDPYSSRKNSYTPAQNDQQAVFNSNDVSNAQIARKSSFTSSQNNNAYGIFSEAETEAPNSRKDSVTSSHGAPYGILNANEASYAYNHSNTSYERRSSHVDYKGQAVNSQGGYQHDGLPPLSNNTLVNGHRYYPASSSLSNNYPAPPINVQPQARRPSGVLA